MLQQNHIIATEWVEPQQWATELISELQQASGLKAWHFSDNSANPKVMAGAVMKSVSRVNGCVLLYGKESSMDAEGSGGYAVLLPLLEVFNLLLSNALEALLQQSGGDDQFLGGEDNTLVEKFGILQAELEAQNYELIQKHLQAQQAKEQLETLFEQAPVPYLEIDSYGAITRLNTAAHQLLGRYQPAHFPLARVIHAEDQKKFSEFLFEVFYSKKNTQHTLRIRTPEDHQTYRYAILSASPVWDMDNSAWRCLLAITDVDKEARLRQQLFNTAQNYQALLDATPQTFVLISADYSILSFNKNAEQEAERYQIKPLQVGTSFTDYAAIGSREDFHKHFNQALGGTPVKLVREFTLNGRSVWYEIQYLPIRHQESDRIDKVAFLSLDITADKEAERQLQYQSNILQNVRSSVIATDLEGRITHFNPGAELIFGYTKTEMTGQTPSVLYPEQDFANMQQDLERIMAGTDYYGVWEGRTKAGKTVWLDIVTTVLRAKEGGIIGFLGVGDDITEQYIAEQKLAASRKRYESILNAAPVMMWEADREGQRVFMNHQWEAFTGTPVAELQQQGWERLIHPDDLEAVRQNYYRQFSPTYGSYEQVFRLLHANGSYRYLLERGLPIFGEKDAFEGFVGGTIDITDQRKLIQELEEVQKRLDAILENTDSLVLSVDTDFRVSFFNRQLDELVQTHLNRPIMRGEKVDYLLPPNGSGQGFRDMLGQALQGHKVFNVHSVKSNGKTRHFEALYSPIVEEDGQVDGVAVLAREVTENRRLTEENLTLARIAEVASNSIIITDTQGRVEWVNKGFRELTGYSLAEVKGKTPGSMLQGPDTDPGTVAAIREAIRSNEPITCELTNYQKDGSKYIVQLNIQPVYTPDRRLVKFVSIQTDITAQHEREEVIRRKNEDLVKLNREMDNFIYRVSHDLRAPLTSSLGLLELTMMEELPQQTNHYLQLQQKSLKKLDQFILDILNYSRNSRMEARFSPVMFAEVIQELIGQLRSPAQQHVNIDIEVKQAAPFMTDLMRIHIVLGNLLSNSLKFINPYRDDPKIEISVQTTEQEAIISVKDNGIGIAPAHLPRVFEMFYRATDTNYGSGLGLYIVKEAVHVLNGTIGVTSIPGEGTEFRLWLPAPKIEEQLTPQN